MKKYLITACLILAFGAAVQAQDRNTEWREKVVVGVKVGANIANVWDSQGQDFQADPKVGFAGGLFLGIPIGEAFGLQPEILFSQKGFIASGTLLGTGYSVKRTTSYIDIPLQFQIKPAEFLTVVLGPQYSFLVHQQDVYTFGANSIVQEQEFRNDEIRKNILGFVAGADLSISNFVFAPRMGWDLVSNNGDGSSSTPRYKNRWIQLTVGVKI